MNEQFWCWNALRTPASGGQWKLLLWHREPVLYLEDPVLADLTDLQGSQEGTLPQKDVTGDSQILGDKGRWRSMPGCWYWSELPDCCHSRDVKSVMSVQLVGKGVENCGNCRDLLYTSSARDACRSSACYRFATEPTTEPGPNIYWHGTTGRPWVDGVTSWSCHWRWDTTP